MRYLRITSYPVSNHSYPLGRNGGSTCGVQNRLLRFPCRYNKNDIWTRLLLARCKSYFAQAFLLWKKNPTIVTCRAYFIFIIGCTHICAPVVVLYLCTFFLLCVIYFLLQSVVHRSTVSVRFVFFILEIVALPTLWALSTIDRMPPRKSRAFYVSQNLYYHSIAN